MDIHLKYFFRKPSETFHSIEELFSNFQSHLNTDCKFENIYMPYHSGIVGRIKNILFTKKNRGGINHITGDVNYISFGLKPKSTVITIHDIGSALNKGWLKRNLIRFIWFTIPLKRAAKITVISEFSKNELLKTFKIDIRKIVVIPNCVSDKFTYYQREFNKKRPNILIVGTKENKNLVRSVEALKDIECDVTIIGKLSESQKKKLKEFDINYKNYFNLSYDEVIENYKKADLLLFATTYEGFGIPIIEAQAIGTPVITSDLQPMNDVAGKGALLVNPFNVSDIREGVEEMINNDDYRNELIIQGLENVKKYRCKQIAQMYFNLYEEVYKHVSRKK